jgi:nucleoside-triphosphatase
MTTTHQPRFALLTGSIGAGKTTAAERLLDRARSSGLSPLGLLAPARVESGEKTGVLSRDVETGEERLLASLSDKGYRFRSETFAWANERLLGALERSPELFLLDEVGPIELLADGGHAPVLEALVRDAPARVVLVVREGLLDPLRQRLGAFEVQVFAVDAETREARPGEILEWLLR